MDLTLDPLSEGLTRVRLAVRLVIYNGPRTGDFATELRSLEHLVCGGATCNDFLRHSAFMYHNAILGYGWRKVSEEHRVAGSDDEGIRKVEYYMIVPSDIAALVKLGDKEPENFVVNSDNFSS